MGALVHGSHEGHDGKSNRRCCHEGEGQPVHDLPRHTSHRCIRNVVPSEPWLSRTATDIGETKTSFQRLLHISAHFECHLSSTSQYWAVGMGAWAPAKTSNRGT